MESMSKCMSVIIRIRPFLPNENTKESVQVIDVYSLRNNRRGIWKRIKSIR